MVLSLMSGLWDVCFTPCWLENLLLMWVRDYPVHSCSYCITTCRVFKQLIIKTITSKRDLKKLEFLLGLWASSSRILFSGATLLLSLNDFFSDPWLLGPLLIEQVSFKSYLSSNKIYLARTTGRDFFEPRQKSFLHMYIYMISLTMCNIPKSLFLL